MNLILLSLAAFSILSLTLSLREKFSLQKNKLSLKLFPLALVYNFSFACFHLYFFETGRIPVIGVVDNPILAWLH
jgi:formate hydrogenlyase subunit 4